MADRTSIKTAKRTDMAVELLKEEPRSRSRSGVKKTEVVVDSRLSKRLNRPKGRYVTLECAAPLFARREKYKPLIDDMASVIRSLSEGCESFLAVGVGNPLLTADALGARTVSLLKTNRGLSPHCRHFELSAFAPGVSGVTGIESVDVVKSITSLVKPDCVLVIDSLASAAVSRLGTAFQLCDSGLVPGSGVGGGAGALSASSLKVKRVVSIGVPLVVYAETIIRESVGAEVALSENVRDLLVTPKDIDLLMGECAHITAEAVNAALGL